MIVVEPWRPPWRRAAARTLSVREREHERESRDVRGVCLACVAYVEGRGCVWHRLGATSNERDAQCDRCTVHVRMLTVVLGHDGGTEMRDF